MTSQTGPAAASQRVVAYLELPHAVPVLFVMSTTVVCALIVPDGRLSAGTLVAVVIAMFGGQLAIGAVNELVDERDDAIAKPTKPIPSGLVPRRHAQVIAGGGLVAMVAASASLGLASLLLCTLGTCCGLAYDLAFKRTAFSWLPYLIALPLLPIWVWTAFGAFDARLLWLYPLGSLAVIGVHLAQILPDIAGDRATGVETLAVRLGERRATALCLLAALSAPLLAAGVAPFSSDNQRLVWIGATIVAGVVAIVAAVVLNRPGLATRLCFPLAAGSAAVMGVVWILGLR